MPMSRDQDSVQLLVVEDNHHDFGLLRDQLSQAGSAFKLVHATRLGEALQCVASESFDAIVLDLNLPDSSGFETYSAIRNQTRGIPIVVLSHQNEAQLIQRTLEHGAQDFLDKAQVTAELLEHSVRHAISRQKLQTQLEGSERQLHMLAEQLPAMLWTTDEHLRLTSIRGRELSALRLSADAVMGQTVDELFAASRAAHGVGELHRRALLGESTSVDLEWDHRWYHAHVEPLRDSAGDLAGTIGVALDVTGEQKLKRDVHAAHQVQQHLLPSRAPLVKGFDIAGRCFPAEDCSGDFFDFIPLPEKRLAVVLADVSGHGFGPAILAAAIRSYLRMAAVLGNQVHEMLALANRLLLSDGDLTPFASVFAASFDLESQSMRYASAGHPAFLFHMLGDTTRLDSLSVPIGVRNDEMFSLSQRFRLQIGDVVLLCSDGVFEARSPGGEYFGAQRALNVVREHLDDDASRIVEHLHSAAVAFAGGAALDDDHTIVVVKVVPTGGSNRETWTA
jgi:serine phosphatase RsbU (regulator of sigma subunit)